MRIKTLEYKYIHIKKKKKVKVQMLSYYLNQVQSKCNIQQHLAFPQQIH